MDLVVYIFECDGESFYWSECDQDTACSSFEFFNRGLRIVASPLRPNMIKELDFGKTDLVSFEVGGISFSVKRVRVSSCTTSSDVEDVVEANEAMITEWGSQEGFATSSTSFNSSSFDIRTPDESLTLPRYLFKFDGSPKYCVVNVSHVTFSVVRDRSGEMHVE